MEIEGTYTLHATPSEVWQQLGDRQTLLHTIPELQRLERVDKYTQSLALQLTYTPLIGTYYGNVRVAEQHFPNHSHIVIERVRDTQNTMSGEVILDLQSHGDTTIVTYKGDVSLHKTGTQVQRTVIKGAAKLLIQQFFTALEEQLWQQQAAKKRAEEEIIIQTATRHTTAQSYTRASQEKMQRVSFLQRIVHLLRFGKGNASEEIRWTERIRRTGYASMLLFLVWVGTRIIPRR
ncbi:MAG: hypothetical protein PVS3B3_15110 [Ktedonobacteraceae bacterium]